MKNKSIQFKGSFFTLIVLYLLNDNVEMIKIAIHNKIKLLPSFFNKTPIVLNISHLSYKVDLKNLKNIIQIILHSGLKIIGITGCNDNILKKDIINFGLPILSESNNVISQDIKNFSFNTSLLTPRFLNHSCIVNKLVRSGQTIYSKNSDLIVVNDVSPGAELIADGNVHIYGSMRGRVLAGANGNISSQIFCTKLFSELVSISGKYWLSEQIQTQYIGKSVRIYLKNNILKIKLI